MGQVDFKNLPNQTTPLNRTNLIAIQNTSAIHTYLNSDTTITSDNTQYALVPLDTLYNSSDSGLTFDATTNEIVVGTNISKVEIIGTICMRTTEFDDGSSFTIGVRKNKNASYQVAALSSLPKYAYAKLYLNAILEVSQGDKLSLWARHVTFTNEDMLIRSGPGNTMLIIRAIS